MLVYNAKETSLIFLSYEDKFKTSRSCFSLKYYPWKVEG